MEKQLWWFEIDTQTLGLLKSIKLTRNERFELRVTRLPKALATTLIINNLRTGRETILEAWSEEI